MSPNCAAVDKILTDIMRCMVRQQPSFKDMPSLFAFRQELKTVLFRLHSSATTGSTYLADVHLMWLGPTVCNSIPDYFQPSDSNIDSLSVY